MLYERLSFKQSMLKWQSLQPNWPVHWKLQATELHLNLGTLSLEQAHEEPGSTFRM